MVIDDIFEILFRGKTVLQIVGSLADAEKHGGILGDSSCDVGTSEAL